jgi:hypothetical protein
MASVAAADAPHSLGKGHWSLGYEANSGSTIQFGIGVADMTRIIASLGVANSDPGGNLDSNTSFGVSGEFRRYMSGMSTNYFSPFFGFGVGMEDSGIEGVDPDLEIFGGFGGEAFVVEPLSIGGAVGIGYTKEGDFETFGDHDGDPLTPDQVFTADGNKTFGTLRSAITATLYWGSDSSPSSE